MRMISNRKVLCLNVILISVLVISGCIESKHELPSGCKVTELLVTPYDVPHKPATASTSGQPIPDSTINSAGTSIYVNSHLLSHAIYWYSSEKYSKQKYTEETLAATLIADDQQESVIKLDPNNLMADDYKIVCGNDAPPYRCIYVGRYKNYVTVLNSEISAEGISEDEYLQVVKLIDEQIHLCE